MTTTITEVVYLGYDNTIDLLLEADGVAVDLVNVNRAVLTFGAYTIDSDVTANIFTWTGLGVTGKMRIKLGGQSIVSGTYKATLVLYDVINTNGIRWPVFLLVAE